jgi:hypothetical protein
MPKIRRSQWALIALLAGGVFLSGQPANSYTVSHCIDGDLYVDFFSSTGEYQGTIRQRNAPACLQNQYPG